MKILSIADFGFSEFTGVSEAVLSLHKAHLRRGEDSRMVLLNNNPRYFDKQVVYLSNIFKFIFFIKEYKPDIVIFHSLYNLKIPLYYLLLRHFNIPYCVKFHGGSSFVSMQKSRWIKSIANRLFFNKFVFNSQGLIYLNKEEYDKSVFKTANISRSFIPNGIQLRNNLFVKRNCGNKIQFLFLSRIDIYYKGVDLLVKAIDRVFNSPYKSQCQFSFYGPRYDEQIIELLQPYGDFARYKGVVGGMEKEMVFLGADIFLLTSRSEGMPMTVLESLSYGCPCIITKETNMEEVVLVNNAGWVAQLSEESIFNTILIAIKDFTREPELYFKNAQNAVSGFSWDIISKKSCDFYKSIINKDFNEDRNYNTL